MGIFKAKVTVPDITQFGTELRKSLAQGDFTQTVDRDVVQGTIVPRILVGLSPVKTFGRFVGYKNPDKYPGNKKPKRPVNLKLTGKLLENYRAFVRAGSLWIGIQPSAPSDVKEYAGHLNEGTENMAARRLVPIQGEQFGVSIVQKLKAAIAVRAQALFKKTKLKSR